MSQPTGARILVVDDEPAILRAVQINLARHEFRVDVSADMISFLSDDVIFQRYVEIEDRMRKVMTMIRMRGSEHSKDLRLYELTATGLVVGSTLYDYRGVITGVAERQTTEVTVSAEPTETGAADPAVT